MNILISYNWLKEYLKTGLKPEEFASRVSLCGPGVERIYPQGDEWDNIVIGRVDKLMPHPNADKLKIARTDIGKGIEDIVCGGSNLCEGMLVAVALSGAMVRWHGEGEPVELKPTEIRGVKSAGMICAAIEIGLGEQFEAKDEREILDLSEFNIKPGASLASTLGLKDTIFDIEITTNRPDALCVLGIAREAGTILRAPLKEPEIKPLKGKKDTNILKIENKEPELCKRYQAIVIDGVEVKESPWWLKKKLRSAGTRSINNIVDITNLVLWEMGQPLHAFDYKKLEGGKIVVRRAKAGEKIKALDGLNYELKSNNLVIADGKRPCAIAGIMGGEESGVTEKTKTIVLESATFEPTSVRKTSRELNLRSESSNLFEKGLSTESTTSALARATELIQELAGGEIRSEVFDLRNKRFRPSQISLNIERANKIIGVDLKASEMADILRRLGFEVNSEGKILKAKAPHWREGDIEIEEDLIEEIARIYGYHNLPSELPCGKIPKEANVPPFGKGGLGEISESELFKWEKIIKDFAVSSGFFEVMPYSLISKVQLDNFNIKSAVKLLNPLSADLKYMRPSLLPGLLKIVSENEKNYNNGKIFELSRVYLSKIGDLPQEQTQFSGLIFSSVIPAEAGISPVFYQIKGFVEAFLQKFGADYEFKKCDNKNYHPARNGKVLISGESIGCFGEIHPLVLKKFNIERRVGFFDFNFEKLSTGLKIHKPYLPLPEYPAIKRDISFVVDMRQEYKEIEEMLLRENELIEKVEVFDVYDGKGVPQGKKSMALHISMRSLERTLEAKEADAVWENITKTLKKNFNAEIRM